MSKAIFGFVFVTHISAIHNVLRGEEPLPFGVSHRFQLKP